MAKYSDKYNPHIPSHKTNGLTAAQKARLNKHAEHHSKKHMDKMIMEMKKGHSFSKAHNAAMKTDPPKADEKSEITIKGKKIEMDKGKLSRELGIPEEKNIPMTLLKKLVKIPNGESFDHKGKSKKMTPGLKKRVSLAITLKGFKK
mgnify:CR=1 FL=1